jgi:hypothetical protein
LIHKITLFFSFDSEQHGEQLAQVMEKIVLVSQVAGVAKRIEREINFGSQPQTVVMVKDGLAAFSFDVDDDATCFHRPRTPSHGESDKDSFAGSSINLADRLKINYLLDEWEEPDANRSVEVRKVLDM